MQSIAVCLIHGYANSLHEQKVIDYIKSYDEPWENGPINRLVMDSQLMAYKHDGFWQPMDTLREKNLLEEMWNRDDAPWGQAH